MATYYENKDLKNRAGVYQIRNLVNGKIYVGSSINLRQRKCAHMTKLARGAHINKHLQSAYNIYGKENFIFEVIEFIENNKILIRAKEMEYIKKLKVTDPQYGYNLKNELYVNNAQCKPVICLETLSKYESGADAGRSTNICISDILKCCGKKANTAGKLHWMYLSEYETASSEEIRNRMSLNYGGFVKVVCVETGENFKSAADAGRSLGIYNAGIIYACQNPQRHITVKGYHWMYKENYDKLTPQEREEFCKPFIQNKKVLCIETGEIFPTISAAARFIGVAREVMRDKCHGRKCKKDTPIRGYHFTFV